MKTNLFKSIAIAAILVGSTACGSAPASFVGSLTDALDDSAWESSAWISAPDAQVVTGTIYDGTRSADGASWFVATVRNGGKVASAKWMTTGLGVYELYLNGQVVGEEILKPGFTHYEKPNALHNFSLYLDGKWFSLTAKAGTFDDKDPIGVLDVDISSRLILDDILGIKYLRSDKRIDFVGGLRGLEELKRRVDSGEMRMALALYPVTMNQIMDIADNGKIMPPKATWFEPKLRSGLIIHKLV